MPEAVVLLGNGPNRLSSSSVSWGDVLDALMVNTPYLRAGSSGKPFPILFEEISIHSRRNYDGDVGSLKKDVASLTGGLDANDVHSDIVKLPIKHILTTNYDYALEKAATAIGRPIKSNEDSERKLSIFRHKELENGQMVWHIHGEADRSTSITLGFEHYTAYLSKLYHHTHGSANEKPPSPFIRPNSISPESWVDIFLASDTYIVGLGLGFEETDLWWVLSLKERLRVEGREVGRTVYYEFAGPTATVSPKSSSLTALGVEVVNVELEADWDYLMAYDRIVRDIDLRISYPETHQWKHNTSLEMTVLPSTF